MNTTRAHKGYIGSAETDMDRLVLRGKILFVRDLVTFEASSPAELQKEFEAAVDDYLETCAELGREPQKPMSGTFNVRITPELHMQACILAAKQGDSLNSLVGQAIHVYVEANCKVQPLVQVAHQHNVSVTVLATKSVLGSTAPTAWETVRTEAANVRH